MGRGSVDVNFPSLPNYDDNDAYKWSGYTETVADQSVVSMTRNGENTGSRTITRVNQRNGSTTITINYPGNIRYDAFTASFKVTLIDLLPVKTIDAEHYTAEPKDESGKPITDALQTEKVYWHITAKPGRTLATDALVVTAYNETPQNVVTMNCANDGVVEINNIDDWNTFATYATGQNARLRANLNVTDLGSRPSNRPYSGTFDGQNHTLTLNYSYKDGTTGDVAPFRYISNATIKNLNVTGNISSDAPNNNAASIVGQANGTCVIENCYSTVAINWSFSTESNCNNAGLVGRVNNGANITFNNCAFVGSFTTPDGCRFGGFVGFIEGSSRATFNYCLMAADVTVRNVVDMYPYQDGNAAFVRYRGASNNNLTFNHCYFRQYNNNQTNQGEQINDDQLKNGYVTKGLQADQSAPVWGQKIGEGRPQLTRDENLHIYTKVYKLGNSTLASYYANKGQKFPVYKVDIPSYITSTVDDKEAAAQNDITIDFAQSLKLNMPTGDGFTITAKLGNRNISNGDLLNTNEALVFNVAAKDGYRLMTPASSTMKEANTLTFAKYSQPQLLRTDGDYALISNKDDWDILANNCVDGNYRLTADIIDTPVTNGVGNEKDPFTGIFDGAGHTLTVNYNYPGDQYRFIAPFRFISGATIKNLNVAGNIITSKTTSDAAGIAGDAQGDSSSFVNCVSSVNITFNGNGDATNGGLLARAINTRVSFDYCAFIGKFTANNGDAFGGFVGYTDDTGGYVVIRNSYVAADFNVKTSKDATTGNAPFARRRHADRVTIDNCYYLNTANLQVLDQGIPFTQQELSNGRVAHGLQKPLNEMHWGQTLTGSTPDPRPVFTDKDEKRVYEVSYRNGDKVVAAAYFNKGGVPGKPYPSGYELEDPDYAKGGIQHDMIVQLILKGVDDNGYALVGSEDDWKNIGSNPNINKYRLVNDIKVTSMVGSKEAPFTYEFNGDGHTITVDYDLSDRPDNEQKFIGPFRYVDGANIHNLRIDGEIKTYVKADKEGRTNGYGKTNDVGGFAAQSIGKTSTFSDCVSAVRNTFLATGDATNGGFVGRANASIEFNNCSFVGGFNAPNGENFGGYVGFIERNHNVTLNNCLTAADFQVRATGNESGNQPFARHYGGGNLNLNNCYYRTFENIGIQNRGLSNGNVNGGNIITNDQLASGSVAYLLQGNQPKFHWGQALNSESADAIPTVATVDSTKRVLRASFIYDNNLITASYANVGQRFSLPGISYVSASPEDFDKEEATKDISVTVELFDKDEDDYLLISSIGEWNNFATYCSNGNFRLTENIDGITTMATTREKPFSGIFDGQGHTLTLAYAFDEKPAEQQDDIAPFRFIRNATFKNLRVAGVISTNRLTNDAAGFASEALSGKNYFLDCESAVDITFKANGDATNAGILGRLNDGVDSVLFNNCAFSGSFLATNGGNCFGGFVGWGNGAKVKISNSLVAAKSVSVNNGNGGYGNASFMRNNPNAVTINNSYYVPFNNLQVPQGTVLDNAKLSTGEQALLLQDKQTELHWGQTLGTDSQPVVTSDEAKRVVVNTYDGSDEKVYDNFITLNENKGNKANITLHADVTGNVKLTRTFVDDWNTLVLPFDLSTEEVEQAFGNETKVAYFTNSKENAVELNLGLAGKKDISANTPVLIRPSQLPTAPVTFANKTIRLTETPMITGDNGIAFIGSYAASYTVAEGEYFIGDSKLWKSSGESSILGTRAYFRAPADRLSSNIYLVWGDDDDPTAINSATIDNATTISGPVYNLNGQKVGDNIDDMPKGIYIVNGKKIKK